VWDDDVRGSCFAALDVLQANWGIDVPHAALAEGFNFHGRRVELTRRSGSTACRLCGILCRTQHMATNLALDPDLLDRAFVLSGERTKKAAVTKALEEFVARREQAGLVELFGALEWDATFEYKTERSRA